MSNKFLNSVKVVPQKDADEERRWIVEKVKSIGGEKLEALTKHAIRARANAYQPYSNYSVGVSVLCTSGNMYDAPNTEVVSYSQTGHAEHNAINKAISEGEAKNGRNFIEAIIVCQTSKTASCGACRQEIAEHCDNTIVINVDPKGNPLTTTSLRTLLPFAFTPKDLGK